ncbi:MAG: PAS domain-containing protein [Planctomycetaceae bacterium]
METHATPLRDDAGQVTSLLSVTRDITEHKLTELSLRESEQRSAMLFRITPAGMAITRLADGVFLDMNAAFAKITGYTREELLGRSPRESPERPGRTATVRIGVGTADPR